GIVGDYNGSQAREVLITLEQFAQMMGQEPEPAAAVPKRNRILPALENAAPPFDAGPDDAGGGGDELEAPLPPRRRLAIQLAQPDDDEEEEEELDDDNDELADDDEETEEGAEE